MRLVEGAVASITNSTVILGLHLSMPLVHCSCCGCSSVHIHMAPQEAGWWIHCTHASMGHLYMYSVALEPPMVGFRPSTILAAIVFIHFIGGPVDSWLRIGRRLPVRSWKFFQVVRSTRNEFYDLRVTLKGNPV